jgi:predicted metal-binding protein
MARHSPLVHPSSPPVSQALVFICEKCGKRAGADKHDSHRLASKLKRRIKSEFSKGDIRIVLTSCMDLCPEDRIAVSLQPVDPSLAPTFWEVDIDDLQGGSEALSSAIVGAIESR